MARISSDLKMDIISHVYHDKDLISIKAWQKNFKQVYMEMGKPK